MERGSLDQPVTLQALALKLTCPANGRCMFARAALGRLFIKPPQLHLAVHPFALKFLLKRAKRLIDIVVTNRYLHSLNRSFPSSPSPRKPYIEPLTRDSMGIRARVIANSPHDVKPLVPFTLEAGRFIFG